ncbi:CBS domain-containing protein [Thermoplasmatota archaeon]
MIIEEVMSTDLIVGYVPGSIKDALDILAKNNVSGMPILKKDTKNVVGVITRTDIFKNSDEDQIALVMNEDFHYIKKDHDIIDAAKILLENRIHGLPVVNNKKNLVGIISPKDIIKKMLLKNNCTINDYFSNLVVPIYENTPINIVMEIINITNENALPILNDKLQLTGITSDGDLFKLSTIQEGIERSDLGLGSDEDQWTWEGIRDTVRLYYSTTQVTLPFVPVKEVMIRNVKKVSKNTPVSDVANMMIKNDISHIPIVNADDRLVGMVSDIDLMACMF